MVIKLSDKILTKYCSCIENVIIKSKLDMSFPLYSLKLLAGKKLSLLNIDMGIIHFFVYESIGKQKFDKILTKFVEKC